MTDSLFKDPTTQAGIKALLKEEAECAADEHQKDIEDEIKNSPEWDGRAESTTSSVKLEIFDAKSKALLYTDEEECDDADPSRTHSNAMGSLLPQSTERQRRFFEASMMCSAISANALEKPGDKILKMTIELTVDTDEGDRVASPQFIAAVTFDSTGMPSNIELADEKGPVDISEMPQIGPIQ